MQKIFQKNKILFAAVIFIAAMSPLLVLAIGESTDTNTAATNTTTSATTSERPAASELVNPIGAETPLQLIGMLTKFLLLGIGAFALVYFIYGGFTWLTSGGNPDRIKKGRDILMWATIGLAATFASYAILKFFFEMLGV